MKISEFGSDYNFSLSSRSENVFLGRDDVKLFFSGRAALYGLVEWGILNDGWQRIFFPTYYCHEVVEFLRPLPIDIVYYNYNPFINSPIDYELFEDNVVKSVFVNVDYFGFSRISSHLPTSVVIIDDLTHNIGDAFSSTADYCFGSLRKVLPIPCGGFLYSSYNKKLPTAPPNEFAEGISMMRLTAMYLKTHYLNGDAVDKNLFRRFFLESEARFSDSRTFAEIPASSLAILPFIDVESILKAKRRNLRFILEALDVVEGVD